MNLSPTDVASYTHDGSDLVLQLSNGNTITLQDCFGAERDLFLREDGQIQMVDLGDPVGGQYFAQYDFLPAGEKWGPFDQLTYLDLQEIEPVVAPLAAFSPRLASALGLGGLAAVTSGGDDDGDDTGANEGAMTPPRPPSPAKPARQ